MSKDLPKIRKGLAQASSYVKQGKAVAAVQAVQDALQAMNASLLKAERTELTDLIQNALQYISSDSLVRSLFPLQLKYTPGEEALLNDNLKDLYASLSEHTLQEAEAAQRAREEAKRARFAKAVTELGENPTKAMASFKSLARDFPQDAQLMGDMGEALLNAGFYEEAVTYLSEALDMKPDMLPFYNVIGIALRKLERYTLAETYYLRASQYLRMDPNLYFNIGRLYVDWGKWEKAQTAARVALKLAPEFEQAQKLLVYAENKLKEKSGA